MSKLFFLSVPIWDNVNLLTSYQGRVTTLLTCTSMLEDEKEKCKFLRNSSECELLNATSDREHHMLVMPMSANELMTVRSQRNSSL